MTSFFQFLLLGLGTGSITAMLGLGLVVIYRGSGTINFAQGAFALLGAYAVYELHTRHGVPLAVSMALAVVLLAFVGLLIQVLLMRPLRRKSSLARVIGTLAVLAILQAIGTLRYKDLQVLVSAPLPERSVKLGSLQVGEQAFWLLGIAVVLTITLTVVSRATRLGLAISAASENQRAAAALGYSPNVLACVAWGTGGAIAGLGGVFFAANTGSFISVRGLSLIIVGALASALLGGFKSYPFVLLAGLLIGIAQSESTNYTSRTGVADSVPFLFIILVLVVRGRGLPVRGSVAERLPRVGNGRVPAWIVLAVTAVFCGLAVGVFRTSWNVALTASLTVGIVTLSVVVVTGFAGQLSLAQFALAGIGGFASGRLVAAKGWPFEGAAAAGVLVAVAVGLLFGLPALRTRGVNLAVVTFGLGFATWSLVFNNSAYTGELSGTVLSPQTLFGIKIDPNANSGQYATVCAAAFALSAIAVMNLRRGRSGRRLLAVRSNERAAASLGVSVVRAKLYAFALGAGIAGLGGVLFTFSYTSVLYSQFFDPFTSVTILTFAVIGGVGYTSGALWGSLLATSGISSLIAGSIFSGVSKWLPLVGGILLVITLLGSPDGIAANVNDQLGRRLPRRPAQPVPRPDSGVRRSTRVDPMTLEVSGVTVRFGGVTAIDNINLSVGPGEVVGLLGPNGAGKTTLVDAVTGYARVANGSISLDGRHITSWAPHRRARIGLSRSFQSLELFPDLSVRENLLAASEDRSSWAYLTDLVYPGKPVLSEVAEAAISEMDISSVLDRDVDELSFSQRKLVAIARSVAMAGSILLLDEPGAGLDESETAELGQLVRRLADEWGIGVLLIEHDVPTVLRTANRIVVMDAGRVIATGTPDEIRHNEAVVAAYLGPRLADHDAAPAPRD